MWRHHRPPREKSTHIEQLNSFFCCKNICPSSASKQWSPSYEAVAATNWATKAYMLRMQIDGLYTYLFLDIDLDCFAVVENLCLDIFVCRLM